MSGLFLAPGAPRLSMGQRAPRGPWQPMGPWGPMGPGGRAASGGKMQKTEPDIGQNRHLGFAETNPNATNADICHLNTHECELGKQIEYG